MEQPQRKHPRLKDFDYSQNGAYFVTICTKNKEKLLGHVEVDWKCSDEERIGMGQIMLSDAGRVCKLYLEQIPEHYAGVFVDCYVIMPDHIHFLLMLDDTAYGGGQESGRPTVQGIVHAFKRLTGKQIGGKIWQSSFYEHVIRNDLDLAETRTYILGNPMKWEIRHAAP